MLSWLTEAFFDPKMTTQRLNAHEYQQSENVRKVRSMENLYLIDFKKMPLKGFTNFKIGMKLFTDSELNKYLKKFLVIFPGDYAMQFFCRQIIYSKTYVKPADRNTQTSDMNVSESSVLSIVEKESFQSFVTFNAALHVQLNGQEDIMLNYHFTLKCIYENTFMNCILVLKPKAWRTATIYMKLFMEDGH